MEEDERFPKRKAVKIKEPPENIAGTLFSCFVGAGVWSFLASDPSPTAWIIASLLMAYLVLGYCLLELYLLEEAGAGRPVKVHGQQASPLQLDIYDA
jgi:hypothetical protein